MGNRRAAAEFSENVQHPTFNFEPSTGALALQGNQLLDVECSALDVAGGGSGEDWVNDFAGRVGEAKVAAVKAIGELGVVETEAM